MALEGVKYVKIPIQYSADGRERNIVMAVFYGEGANPDYSADGFGPDNKTHTAAECLAYLNEKLGVKFSAGLTPLCTEKAYNETAILFGERNILATTRPRETCIPDFEEYFFGTDSDDPTTGDYARIQLIDAYGGQLHEYFHNSFGIGGGVFAGNDTRQIFLPLVFINPYPVNATSGITFREYKLYCEDVNNENTYFITSSTTTLPFGQFWRLAWTKGGMELIEERSSDVPPEQEDPNDEAGNSEEQNPGGDGNHSLIGDTIGISGVPTISAVDLGLISLWNPSVSELKTFSSWLWNSSLSDIDFWKKLFINPMDLIIGVSIVPVDVANNGRHNLILGSKDTGIKMYHAASQYAEVDCGYIDVPLFYGSSLDFAPFTKITCFLPYIGFRDLSPDEVMGRRLGIKYRLNLLDGGCVCFLTVNGSVLYEFSGQCAAQIPITGSDFRSQAAALLTAVGGAVATLATAGAAAPAAAETAAASEAGLISAQTASTAAVGMTINSAFQAISQKPNYQRSGSLTSSVGQMSNQKPFLEIIIPRQSLPTGYKSARGYPSNIRATIGSLTGYTEVSECHLEGIPATDDELAAIETQLKKGIIIR